MYQIWNYWYNNCYFNSNNTFEVLARLLSNLFGLTGGTTQEIIDICTIALRIASVGFVFMGFSVAVQGVLHRWDMQLGLWLFQH